MPTIKNTKILISKSQNENYQFRSNIPNNYEMPYLKVEFDYVDNYIDKSKNKINKSYIAILDDKSTDKQNFSLEIFEKDTNKKVLNYIENENLSVKEKSNDVNYDFLYELSYFFKEISTREKDYKPLKEEKSFEEVLDEIKDRRKKLQNDFINNTSIEEMQKSIIGLTIKNYVSGNNPNEYYYLRDKDGKLLKDENDNYVVTTSLENIPKEIFLKEISGEYDPMFFYQGDEIAPFDLFSGKILDIVDFSGDFETEKNFSKNCEEFILKKANEFGLTINKEYNYIEEFTEKNLDYGLYSDEKNYTNNLRKFMYNKFRKELIDNINEKLNETYNIETITREELKEIFKNEIKTDVFEKFIEKENSLFKETYNAWRKEKLKDGYEHKDFQLGKDDGYRINRFVGIAYTPLEKIPILNTLSKRFDLKYEFMGKIVDKKLEAIPYSISNRIYENLNNEYNKNNNIVLNEKDISTNIINEAHIKLIEISDKKKVEKENIFKEL